MVGLQLFSQFGVFVVSALPVLLVLLAPMVVFMQGQLAEQALQDFEVELGIRTPETTPVASSAKDLGPATIDKAAEKQTN